MKKQLTLFTLIMLITGSIDSIRNLPATALFGSSIIFFLIFSAIVFLIPTGLVSAELSASMPTKGGIYHWVRTGLGARIGFLAVWLQWINTMVWYPTILSFIAGTLAYLLNPALATDKFYLITVILVVFWGMTWINLRGLHLSAKFATYCALVGMVLPMILIVGCAAVWLCMGEPLQIHFTASNMVPHMGQSESWISLTAIMTAFLGMELTSVHVNQIKDPQHAFPKALFFSGLIILLTMALGSLAIAAVLPANQISLVSGVMQAFENFFAVYHLSWFLPIMTIMILLGSLGGMTNWVLAPAKGLLQAAEHGFLPAILARQNKYGAPSVMLLLQAVLVSLICFAFLLMPSVNGSYWLLTDLSTQLYILMYVLMFIAAFILRTKLESSPSVFKIPGGIVGMGITCILGLIGCIVTLVIGFFPPDGIEVGGTLHYEIMFTSGLVIMIVPVLIFYGYEVYRNRPVSH